MKTPWIVLVVAIVAALAVAGVVTAIVYSGSEADSETAADQVVIEMRAMPPAKLRLDGKLVGTTPMSLHFPRSDRQIEIEATMVKHLVRRGGSKDIVYKDKRTVTLDRDQLLDFKADAAHRVSVTRAPALDRAHPIAPLK